MFSFPSTEKPCNKRDAKSAKKKGLWLTSVGLSYAVGHEEVDAFLIRLIEDELLEGEQVLLLCHVAVSVHSVFTLNAELV